MRIISIIVVSALLCVVGCEPTAIEQVVDEGELRPLTIEEFEDLKDEIRRRRIVPTPDPTVTVDPVPAPVPEVSVVVDPTPENFDSVPDALAVARAVELPLVLVFRQTVCPPCDQYDRDVVDAERAGRGKEYILCEVNTDQDAERAALYGVERTPAVAIRWTTKDGRGETFRLFQFPPAEPNGRLYQLPPSTPAELLALVAPKSTVDVLTFTTRRDQAGEWRWHLRAANNRTIADSGEGYQNRADCRHAIDLIRSQAATAVVVEQ